MAHVANRSKAKAAKPVQSGQKSGSTVQRAGTRSAKQQAKKIVAALHEAQQMHKGKRKGKTFDEFFQEL